VAAISLRESAVKWWRTRDGTREERLKELMVLKNAFQQELLELETRYAPTSDKVKSKMAKLATIEKEIEKLK